MTYQNHYLFYGVILRFETAWREIAELIQKDFQAFSVGSQNASITIKVLKQKPVYTHLKWKWNFNRLKTCDQDFVRYNLYEEQALSRYDFSLESGEITTENLSLAHEIAYLMALSRTGKKMELAGFHKIHAMSFAYRSKAVVLSMESGEGKSTLLLEILKNPSLQFLSDDCPVVTKKGTIASFPIRLGLSEKTLEEAQLYPENLRYSLSRRKYGLKELLCAEAFPHAKPGFEYDRIVLIFGHKGKTNEPKLESISSFRAYYLLLRPFLIGVGLPIILEYFWESGIRDFFTKTKIAISRMVTAFRLVQKSEVYELELSCDLKKDAQLIKSLSEA